MVRWVMSSHKSRDAAHYDRQSWRQAHRMPDLFRAIICVNAAEECIFFDGVDSLRQPPCLLAQIALSSSQFESAPQDRPLTVDRSTQLPSDELAHVRFRFRKRWKCRETLAAHACRRLLGTLKSRSRL